MHLLSKKQGQSNKQSSQPLLSGNWLNLQYIIQYRCIHRSDMNKLRNGDG